MLSFRRKRRQSTNRMEPMTLTDATRRNGLLVMTHGVNSAHLSSSRSIPYSEIYSLQTGMMETPAERLQRAAEDEAKRETRAAQ